MLSEFKKTRHPNILTKLKRRFCFHKWDKIEATRLCLKCGAYEMLMSKPYPKIGEPKYTWKRVDIDIETIF